MLTLPVPFSGVKQYFRLEALTVGLAMFSMFFGAGNVIFPLAVGQFAGDKNLFAMSGLILTAAVMPIAGVIAMILFDGNIRQFFGRIGKTPGFLLAIATITLLGPLGSTPRCIALSFTTLKTFLPGISPVIFSACACGIIFLFTFRKTHLLTLLGWVLTPVLLGSLITIIIMGWITPSEIQTVDETKLKLFFHGLKEGYNTMDLLAAFFFSSTILNILRKKKTGDAYLSLAGRASVVGAILLSLIYIGFSTLASFHGGDLQAAGKDELLALITMKIAGPYAGLLICLTVALACLTTAVALITAFCDYFQKEVFKEKISYRTTLVLALFVTFFVATFEFSGISAFLSPILQICYPGLIVLTFLNIAYRFRDFKPIKTPVFLAFAMGLGLYFFAR